MHLYPPSRKYFAIIPSKTISDYLNFAQSNQKQFFSNVLAQCINGRCANRFLEACYKNRKKAESNNKIAQSPRKQFPKSYFTQSIATILRNPSEKSSSIIVSRAQCFLKGGHVIFDKMLWPRYVLTNGTRPMEVAAKGTYACNPSPIVMSGKT